MSLEDIFTLPAEYNELRSSVRALSEKEIAPFAQAVDADELRIQLRSRTSSVEERN